MGHTCNGWDTHVMDGDTHGEPEPESAHSENSLPAADLTAGMEIMAERCGSMDDSFHFSSFPHMAWFGTSTLAHALA